MSATAEVTCLRCGSLSLDVETRELAGPRGAIRLDPLNFAMMERLMRRPGVIVEDTAMVSALWPEPDDEPDDPDNTLRHKASVLRGTICVLGCAGRNKVSISRERGVGFFIEVRSGGRAVADDGDM